MATTQTTQAAQATGQAELAGTIRVAVPEHSLRTDIRAASIVWRRELIRFRRDRLRTVTSLIQPLLFLLVLGTGLSSLAQASMPPGIDFKTFIANVNLSGQATKFTILSGFSTHKLRELPFNSFDLAYVDGSGKGIVMLSDLVSTWNLLKVGGVIICSRYSLSERLRNALNLQPADPGPHEAIDTFVKFYKPYITVVAFEEHQVFIRKNRSAE